MNHFLVTPLVSPCFIPFPPSFLFFFHLESISIFTCHFLLLSSCTLTLACSQNSSLLIFFISTSALVFSYTVPCVGGDVKTEDQFQKSQQGNSVCQRWIMSISISIWIAQHELSAFKLTLYSINQLAASLGTNTPCSSWSLFCLLHNI